MKSLTRTMTILVVFNLAMGGFAFAQGASVGEKTPTYMISGSVGLPGVKMLGLPGEPVTTSDGTYSAQVKGDWVGRVMPTKEGYKFTPAQRAYMTPIKDMANQDYTAEPVTYTISGRVGVGGVLMTGLPGDPIADDEGKYGTTVQYGWRGTVAPAKEGYKFMPPSRPYAKVTANLTNQDYVPNAVAQGADGRYDDRMYDRGSRSTSRRMGRSTGYNPAISPVGSRKVLVVPTEEVKAEDLAAITEDMQVMSYILDERFKETRRIQGVFIDFGDFFGRDNRQTEATYLQGYGVLFAMEVNFAFSPPPAQQKPESEQPGEQVDSTWQRAKQEVFSPQESPGVGMSGSPDEYNSRMVEELQRDLIATLQHAANIRALQPDEWVILTVIGGRPQFGGPVPMMGGFSSMPGGSAGAMGGMGGFGGGVYGGMGTGMGGGMMYGGMGGGMGGGMMGGGMGGMGMGMGGMAGAGEFSPATVLTIRAKKSDIDAFANGEIDFERFKENVKTLMY